MLNELIRELIFHKNSEKAKIYQRFFKTRSGEYGEGDVFLGLTMPQQREIAKKYPNLSLSNLQKLLNSEIHEHRMISLIILTNKYKEASKDNKKELIEELVNFYLKNAKKINNWDLVDVTAPSILGHYLLKNPKQIKIIYNLSKSKNLWEKRISIVSTYALIKENKLADTLKISEILLTEKHDLIHKAIGWMLREVGKQNIEVLKDFLKTHYEKIPRTTLRYSIERFPEKERKRILKGIFN